MMKSNMELMTPTKIENLASSPMLSLLGNFQDLLIRDKEPQS
jgi:hypothetical protein